MDIMKMTDAMPLSPFHAARARSAVLASCTRGMAQGTGVSASVVGGGIALLASGSAAAPQSLINDVAYVRTGSPPV